MNACLLAAAAMNAARNRNNESVCGTSRISTEICFKIRFRMDIHFQPIRIVKITEETVAFDDLLVPKFTIINTDDLKLSKLHTFSLSSKECPQGPDKYVQENLDWYTSSEVWQSAKEEMINNYLIYTKEKYNTDLIEQDLDYTTHYSWEVDYE